MNNQLQSELLSCINSYPKDTLAVTCDNISDFNLNSNLQDITINSNVKIIKLIPKNSQYNYELFNNESELELVSVIDKNIKLNNDNIATTQMPYITPANNYNDDYKTTQEVPNYNHNEPKNSIAFEYLPEFIFGCLVAALITTLVTVICKLFHKTNITVYRDYCDAMCSLLNYIIIFILMLLALLHLDNKIGIFPIISCLFVLMLSLFYNLLCSIRTNNGIFRITVSFITKIILGIVTLFYIHSFFCKPRRSDDETTYEYHKRCRDYSKDSLLKSTILLTIMYNIIEYRVFIYDPNNMVEEEYDEDDEEYYDEDEYDEYEEIDNKKYLK